MIQLRHIRDSLIAGFHGVQEAIFEVAEKVNLKVQETKISLEIRDLLNEMNRNHARLGEAIYQLKGQDITAAHESPEINRILNTCKTLHQRISRLHQKYQEIDENRLNGQMNLLKLNQLLEKRNIKLMHLTIRKNSPLKGCRVKDLKLSPDVLILCVIRKNRLMVVNGDTRFDDQDSIFVMGPQPQIDQIKEEHEPNPQ
jgi:Trk K+ transport system NAD-binding subunit